METRDWSSLFKRFDSNKVGFNKNRHLFTKVAFDVYQLNSSPLEALWILEADDNGDQYLVATYDDQSSPISATGSWTAMSNKEASDTTLYYKDTPVCKLALKDFGVDRKDVAIFERMLVEKTNNSPDFVQKLIYAQTKDKQETILQQFPELL